MPRLLCSAVAALFLLSGCASAPRPQGKTDVTHLTQLLLSVNNKAPKEEAKRLAEDVMEESDRLEKAFGREGNPYWHNFLVNIGVKKKGLCYHYSDGLYRHLTAQYHYPHFRFHLIGAHIGEYWREHNALAVSAPDKPVRDGIVIDPWRCTGAVYADKISEDRTYRWRHRPERESKEIRRRRNDER